MKEGDYIYHKDFGLCKIRTMTNKFICYIEVIRPGDSFLVGVWHDTSTSYKFRPLTDAELLKVRLTGTL